MSAVYRALLAEGDHYLEEAQDHLSGSKSGTRNPSLAAAHANLAAAFYARAALEKPDPVRDLVAKLAAMKPPTITASTLPDAPATLGEQVAQSMNRHPAGKRRAAQKPVPRKANPRSVK